MNNLLLGKNQMTQNIKLLVLLATWPIMVLTVQNVNFVFHWLVEAACILPAHSASMNSAAVVENLSSWVLNAGSVNIVLSLVYMHITQEIVYFTCVTKNLLIYNASYRYVNSFKYTSIGTLILAVK